LGINVSASRGDDHHDQGAATDSALQVQFDVQDLGAQDSEAKQANENQRG